MRDYIREGVILESVIKIFTVLIVYRTTFSFIFQEVKPQLTLIETGLNMFHTTLVELKLENDDEISDLEEETTKALKKLTYDIRYVRTAGLTLTY